MKPFILTIDTEPDDGAWQGLSTRNLAFSGLEGLRRFGTVAREFDLKPTLLVTYSVATHPGFEGLLQESGLAGRSEIGMHLHPADTPPFGPWDENGRDNLLKIPDDALSEKFARLHAELSGRFGAPVCFRGGAWSLDQRLMGLLSQHGYRVDSSVTPGVSWLVNNRPSYVEAPMRAYYPDPGNLSKPVTSGILEIPVSIHVEKELPPWLKAGKVGSLTTMPLYSQRVPLVSLWRKLRPPAPVWLRPAFTSLQAMRQAATSLAPSGYLHGMCHSNEFWPGASPYSSNLAECDTFFARLEGLCRLAREKGYTSATLSEARVVLAPGVLES